MLFLSVFAAGFAYYFYLHQQPYTQNAFLIANVSPVSALVPGPVTDIYVTNNSKVKKGDKIVTIYKDPYIWKLEAAKNDVDSAKSLIVQLEKQIELDKDEIAKNQYLRDNAWYQSNMYTELNKQKIVSDKDAENLLRQAQAADAVLQASKAQLAVTTEQINGARSALKEKEAQLELQKINLEQTTVYAKSDGTVTNMYLSPGTYMKAGDFMFAFIEDQKWWIQANFKETELGCVRAGQKAKIKLWLYPDKVFHGQVDSIQWGVNRQESSPTNALPVVEKENDWFILPQRFPVQITISDPDPSFPLHVGASAYVTIETDSQIFRQIIWQLRNYF